MADCTEESIHAAVRSGNIRRVREVLRRSLLCVNDLEASLDSPLHLIYDHIELNDLNNQADDRLPIMKLLIEHGANVNNRNRKNVTPLFPAIEKHQINGVKMLLENKADPNIRDNLNRTALMAALLDGYVNNKDDKIIKMLLDYKADPNLSDRCGETALDYAIELNELNYIQILLASDARVKNIYRTFSNKPILANIFQLPDEEFSTWNNFLLKHIDQIVERGQFVLSHLGYNNEVPPWNEYKRIQAFLKLLRKQGIRVNYSILPESNLHKAVREGNRMLIKVLLEKEETNVNVQNSHFDTPLHLVMGIENGIHFEKISRLLLNAGSNWRAPNLMDETPFYLAVNGKRCILVKLMLSKIATVDERSLEYDIISLPNLKICYTENDIALHELLVAISVNCERVIDHLLDEAYNIDEKSKSCRQDITIALVKAVELNKYDTVKKLLEAGFRSDGRFTGEFFNCISARAKKIRTLCLLWEFNDEQILVRFFYEAAYKNSLFSRSERSIRLLLFYCAADNYYKQSILTRLQASFQLENPFTAIFTECNDGLKNETDLSVFNIMAMELDSFVKLLNNQDLRDVCKIKLEELQNLTKLKYYHVAIKYRLELALEKNMIMNAALDCFNDISKNCLSRTNLSCLPYKLGWDTLSHLNMRDLKKLAKCQFIK